MAAAALGQPAVHVPATSAAVMIDGEFSPGEWTRAANVEVEGAGRIYFQRSGDFVYIAVEYTRSPSGIVDLYLSEDGKAMYDLHDSAKLG